MFKADTPMSGIVRERGDKYGTNKCERAPIAGIDADTKEYFQVGCASKESSVARIESSTWASHACAAHPVLFRFS